MAGSVYATIQVFHPDPMSVHWSGFQMELRPVAWVHTRHGYVDSQYSLHTIYVRSPDVIEGVKQLLSARGFIIKKVQIIKHKRIVNRGGFR